MVKVLALVWMVWIGQVLAEETNVLPLATGEWPPYTSAKMEEYGIVTEITTLIIKEMGMTPKYHFVPWPRAEKMTKHGSVFAAFPYAITAERKHEFRFSDRIMINPDGRFFYMKPFFDEPINADSLADLKSYRLGVLSGEASITTLTEAGIYVEAVPTDSQNIKRLIRGRIDFILMDEHLGWHLIRTHYPNERGQFAVLDTTFQQMLGQINNPDWDSYLMISPHYPNAKELTKRFNAALKRVKDNGSYDEILKKYNGSAK